MKFTSIFISVFSGELILPVPFIPQSYNISVFHVFASIHLSPYSRILIESMDAEKDHFSAQFGPKKPTF
jgi:hypothetical protein